MSDTDRPHDVVVWGATGVAGGLVAEYLAERYDPEELALALGGRDADRLDALATDLAETDDRPPIPTVVGDATDPESLRALAQIGRASCRERV